ncbi:sodium:proton antiporter [Deinococcus sp. KSM4-11]|uniref:cation:proton antiporter n=1 Tax=Deinococcus sp. KSM4-11 TaxID=2568654 RepID=UPI0010A58DEB|nr:sodium:proton antiporter [Deinococcus sp. KSM4-11]THF84340.1 sodium:proton antiporter [Deinococcus sp. KSM4-11]
MSLLDLSALLIVVTGALAFLNNRFLKLPPSIGVTALGLALSVLLLLLVALKVPFAQTAVALVKDIQFEDFVFQGVLSFLLFAGALGVNSRALWALRGPVLTFALLSTALSTALVGLVTFGLVRLFGLDIPVVYCLLFGALISPTDPVSVLGVLKRAQVPRRIETLVAGESLFNDGVGVVAFAVIASVATAAGAHGAASAPGVALFFAQEALGGLLLGSVLGVVGWWALRHLDDFVVEVLITLGVVVSCTAVAAHLHTSAPLAAVAAGLVIGLLNDRVPATLTSHEKFEGFWELTDELLNIVLFVLLALKVVALTFNGTALILGVLAVPLLLAVRAVSVAVPVWLLGAGRFPPFTRRLMVWGGLRGAISVALAFSVPAGPERELFLVMTYVIVVFSVLVQGLTMGGLARRAAGAETSDAGTAGRTP